jgi:hypothetical protein
MPAVLTPRTRFLHVPKTGGTWVWGALVAAGVEIEVLGLPPPDARTNHWGLRETEDYDDRFTIAFVRHPLDWWRSLWAWRMRDGWDPRSKMDSIAGSEDFNTFIERIVEHFPGHLETLFARYIGPPSRPITFIGRYEALVDDLARALREAGEDFDEHALRSNPPALVSDYERFPALYRQDLAVRLADSERAVIERFYADEPIPARFLAAPKPFSKRAWRAITRSIPKVRDRG